MENVALNRSSQLFTAKARAHLQAFVSETVATLAAQVDDILLFGSRARGDARADSDYDVAVIVKEAPELRRLNHLVADLAYPHIVAGVHIRPVVMDRVMLERVALGGTLRREGISILS
jgi:predicted nucleotidyltransferase